MTINHDDEYHTDHPKPKDWYWQEPIPPGVKNLDNLKIDFPEHNFEEYTMYSNKGKEDPQFLVDANMDTIDHEADKYEERMKIQAEQTNGYFNQEVTDDMLPDWMQNNDEMYETEPSDWT